MDPWFVVMAFVIFLTTMGITYFVGNKSQPTTKYLEDEVIRLRLQVDMMKYTVKPPADAPTTRHTETTSKHTTPSRSKARMLEILHAVEKEPKTAREIQTVLGQSREHVARLVRKMSQEGYLIRRGTRPFLYIASQKGLKLVSEG